MADNDGRVTGDMSHADNLNCNINIRGISWGKQSFSGKKGLYRWSGVDKVATCSFWAEMEAAIEALLDTGDPYTQAALEYASSKVNSTIECL